MAEQREGLESFPKNESTGAGSNAGNSGADKRRTGEEGYGDGRSQEGVAGQGTGQIKGPEGERRTSR